MYMTFIKHRLWIAVGALLLGVFFMPQQALAADVTKTLCAAATTLTMPNGEAVTAWGYGESIIGDCTDATPTVPGPVIEVNAGDTVHIVLHNGLGATTGLVFQGQAMVPDLTGVADGASTTYNFTAGEPGTYLYEAGLIPGSQYQVAMGLYGALVVQSSTPGQAYADPSTAFTVEKVVVVSEIDPALNNSATPWTFDLRNFKARYGLINGKAFPDTNLDPIAVVAGDQLLLRYVNAGLQPHSMALLGGHQTVIAMDGSPLTYSHGMVAETIAPGQTADAIVSIAATALAGTKYALYEGDLQLHNSNTLAMGGIIPKNPSPSNAIGYGGMLTFVSVGTAGSGGPDTTGPETTNVTVTPNPTTGASGVTLNAVISDAATGGNGEAAAEYFIDTIGADGSGASFTPNTSVVIGAGTLNALSSGNHTIYVHGQDGLGNWGATNFVVLNLDKTGPASSGLLLNPNPTNGSVNVTLAATANDTASGGGNIQAAEYYIGAAGAGGTGTAMSLNTSAAPIASASATLLASTVVGMSEGANPIFVRSQDALGNWGDATQIDLIVDKTGPNVSAVNVAPNPNNGAQSYNSGQDSVRVDATIVDVNAEACPVLPASMPDLSVATIYMPLVVGGVSSASADTNVAVVAAAVSTGVRAIARAEGFIDTQGPDGTGFVLAASDGVFDCTSEDVTALIPLATIRQLSDGPHTINVHAQDNAGNWGGYNSATLVVDQGAPTVTNVAAAPNPTAGATNVALTATANDAVTAIVAAEWFAGADPGVGNGAAMNVNGTALDVTIDVSAWTNGDYTLSVRAKDEAGNWSTATSVVLTVSGASPPATGFHFSTVGNTNPPGVGGTADNADVYAWDGSNFSRTFDATTHSIPGAANVDGLAFVDANHFYVSFADNISVAGLGTIADEDIAYYNNGVWSIYFNGSDYGLGSSAGLDIDAFDIVGGTIYFSTVGNITVPGVGGTADDADIYAWNGASFSRVFDASTHGAPGAADVDALSVVDATHFYVSFNADVTVSGVGAVQDEDVLYFGGAGWSVYFDGTGAGLTAGAHDVDALDIP